ncbi:hypothetical protein JTB14_025576 [Gonioctena quinquepunctata]|nr:hypothetical protein JTB14_025576 [Gonioctena quinquepunctata]
MAVEYYFTVLTDHQAFRWLHLTKSPADRPAHRSIFLQVYDFNFAYRREGVEKIAHALSGELCKELDHDHEEIATDRVIRETE